MDAFGGEGLADHGFDPDETVWVRGVDYVAGWREAHDAGAALSEALAAAGIDVASVRAQAHARPDGSGEVTLKLPTETARQTTELLWAMSRWGRAS
ncbi:hypothetical protein [Streptomyces paromomycinus]|uniref:Uncharacterized protein n=1 Tax=Streptomyces paromomycinus TaxID=92743 RepID=A0A401WBQ8_STREY|nr:hypothetical protein [Streptomyces paromomycinus]GCD46786.1 hypothetical protein GKJPGBOP_06537 [Streptomyces paromomycinus]